MVRITQHSFAFWNNAPVSASAADDITLRIVTVVHSSGPLSCGRYSGALIGSFEFWLKN